MEQNTDLVKLLSDLIPEDLEIEALDGSKYKLPKKLSARRQIKAIRLVEKGMQILDGIDIDEASFESPMKMFTAAAGLLGDERVIDFIDEAFTACYPEVAEACGGLPSDAFDVEDLVKAFGPLALAFAKTMTKATTLMGQPAK